jgi:hypothetical protein
MAQLIDPKTEQALWAESYEQDLENVLLLWSEVAQTIAGEVQVALTPEETKRLAGARPVNPEALDAYLKGTYHWQKLTPEDQENAESYFELQSRRILHTRQPMQVSRSYWESAVRWASHRPKRLCQRKRRWLNKPWH